VEKHNDAWLLYYQVKPTTFIFTIWDAFFDIKMSSADILILEIITTD
jgi:hypothetical protein